jgi:hypothetical protein
VAPPYFEYFHPEEPALARNRQRQVLSHPVRVAILDLFTFDTGRSLAVDTLLADLTERADLAEQHPTAFRDLNAARVRYHLARLKEVDLLPAGS